MELVDFLRARLDDDEQAARRAGDSFRQIGETGVIVATEGDRAEECASANWGGIAEHIVRHDPARVLAEVDAKREILRLHDDSTTALMVASGTVLAGGVKIRRRAYEDVLKLLALPYAGHEAYREDWRP
ncbi:DUF6221 family protein [Streptomyces sp. NPDC006208]|uniref:DUF6221 family protein n=1 Tax=Streptomyces sp. NPDC006208 TaxID=3156734 RepID=UPI0033BDD705